MNTQNTMIRQDYKKEKTLLLNPLINKLSSVMKGSDVASTYSGVLTKFGYFMLMIAAGVAAALMLYQFGGITMNSLTDEIFAEKYVIISLLVAAGMFILFPFVAFLARKTIPLFGALYCVATGFLLGCILPLDAELAGCMTLALVLTFSIVIVMAILYFKGVIHVTQKFRAVTMTLFTTMVVSGCLLWICSFIPMLREGLMVLRSNLVLSIVASLGGVIIATLFLLIDFDTIRQTVEDRLPKQYEWYAAFSLAFTIVWLYFKVLQLLLKIKELND